LNFLPNSVLGTTQSIFTRHWEGWRQDNENKSNQESKFSCEKVDVSLNPGWAIAKAHSGKAGKLSMLIPQPNMSQLCLSLLFLLFALAVVVPSHATTAASESQRLIETGETSRQWMTESEVRRLKAEGVNFMDITDFSDLGLHPINNAVTLPTTLTIGAAPVRALGGGGREILRGSRPLFARPTNQPADLHLGG